MTTTIIVLSIISAALLGALIYLLTYRRRALAEVSRLSDYLRRLRSGESGFEIADEDEGELAVLKSELYKLSTHLAGEAEVSKEDARRLSETLANIAHQLRTPLTSAGIMADLLADESTPPEKRAEFTLGLTASIERMDWLVVELLKMARLDSGTLEFKTEMIEAEALIQEALAPLLAMIELRNQTIQMSSCAKSQDPQADIRQAMDSATYAQNDDAGHALSVSCDPMWTREALSNIIKNASEHSPDGGTIRIEYGKSTIYSFITVTDSGPGIPKADLPRVFERFYSSGKRGGAGIGLSMSLAIMRMQGGNIEAKNTEKGAAFTLKFYR